VPEQKTEAVFFDFGGGTALELVAPRDGNPGLGSFLKRRGPGLHHLAIEVESVERGLAALVRAGLQPIDSHPRPGARGHRVAFLHPRSTGGVLLELVEHKDEHREEAARGDGKGEGKNVEPEEARAG
jgi:methylmalonyl-CoA/ethylmalonyl-CoA epimerase